MISVIIHIYNTLQETLHFLGQILENILIVTGVGHELIQTPIFHISFTAFILVFCISLLLTPIGIKWAYKYGLTDRPSSRKSHKSSVPLIGGLSIFSCVFIALLVITIGFNIHLEAINFQMQALIFCLGLLILLGISDDVFLLSPRLKFVFQILISSVFILLCDLRIADFHGIFGISYLSSEISFLFTLFVTILLINAFNLVDGIDGLATSIGILCTVFFGYSFYQLNIVLPSILMFTYSGGMVAFLIFNFKKKLFLGDNGSMSLGLLVAYGIITVLSHEIDLVKASDTYLFLKNSPVLLLALVSYPLLDTLRVFVVRFLNGKSPFSADNNHIHHLLLRQKLSHFEVTSCILVFTIFNSLLAYKLRFLDINIHLCIMVLISFSIYIIPLIIGFEQDTKPQTPLIS